jgi:hypothetical protein
MSVDQLTNASFEAVRCGLSHFQSKAAQDDPQAHLQVMPLALHQLACRQYCAQLLGWQ